MRVLRVLTMPAFLRTWAPFRHSPLGEAGRSSLPIAIPQSRDKGGTLETSYAKESLFILRNLEQPF